jgi:hypothetical protein
MLLCFRKKGISDALSPTVALKMNEKMAAAFAAVPFAERVVFAPHCMRNSEKCAAKEMGSYYLCMECGHCKAGAISAKCKELGYKAFYLLKGGRAVEKLLKEHAPKAVVGIACYYEGLQGMEQASKGNATVQFVPLTRDGCVNTDVNIADVFQVLEKKK